MRGSGWLLPVIAIAAWVMCIAWPAINALLNSTSEPSAERVQGLHSMRELMFTSAGWAFIVALASMVIGWAPGRWLAHLLVTKLRAYLVAATIVFIPVCLPSYLVFYAWWQSWPADSAFHQWVVANHIMQWAREGTLFLGLLCWSWPLVSWCVAGQSTRRSQREKEMLALDGAGMLQRFALALRHDGRGLAIGGLLVFLATLANTTSFDLAEVFTVANELRAMQALRASTASLLSIACPLMALTLLLMALVMHLIIRRTSPETSTSENRKSGVGLAMFSVLAILATAVLPLGLFLMNVISSTASRSAMSTFSEFVSFYKWSVANTLGYAAVSSFIAAAVMIGLAAMWRDSRKAVRAAAMLMTGTWLFAAVVPGSLTGAAIRSAYDSGMLKAISDHPIILNIGHLTCFGFVAALLAIWMHWRESQDQRDVRIMDGPQSITAFFATSGSRLFAGLAAASCITWVLAVSEIPVTAVINPPHAVGSGPLSLTLLNDMHYQRPQTVLVAAIGMILLAMATAIAVAGLLKWRSPSRAASMSTVIVAASVLWLQGCGPDDPEELVPLKPQTVFGVAGTALGQYAYPRALDVDPKRECLYIIDKQARVQRVGFDGVPQLQWKMPEMENGKPTGVSVAEDGRVFVADTHYFRVIAYGADGHELMRFGEFGREPGQFIYTTDVAFGPQGRLYVSEYGGNDRIQVFDSAGAFLFQFGAFGPEPGQLNRPQAIAFNPDKSELFVADACNHRICVFDPEGKFLRRFGSAGRGAGELMYPYGITFLSDATLIVAEFGNNRVQRFDQTGKPLGIYGGIGRAPGQLQYPWAVAAAGDRMFVLDSGNNRVQVVRRP